MKKTVLAALILGAALTMGVSAYAQETEQKVIGTKAENSYEVKIKNATGRPLSAIELRKTGGGEFTEKLTEDGLSIAADEEILLYYTPEAAPAAEEKSADEAEEAKAPDPLYDLRVTFGDDSSTAELNKFPFEDMESCEIRYEEGLVFIVYKSLTTGKEVSTKEDAKALIEQVQAAQKAAEEAAAAAAASASTSADSSSDSGSSDGGDYDYDSDYDYDDYDYDDYDDYDDEPADPGCLDDGLVF